MFTSSSVMLGAGWPTETSPPILGRGLHPRQTLTCQVRVLQRPRLRPIQRDRYDVADPNGREFARATSPYTVQVLTLEGLRHLPERVNNADPPGPSRRTACNKVSPRREFRRCYGVRIARSLPELSQAPRLVALRLLSPIQAADQRRTRRTIETSRASAALANHHSSVRD